MANDSKLRRYRKGYAALLRLYPKSFRNRFSDEMLQTFSDMCRSRVDDGQSLLRCVLWIYGETMVQILRENMVALMSSSKNLLRWVCFALLVLMVPAIAMQFTDEVRWTASDFVIALMMMVGGGFAFELLRSRSQNMTYLLGSGLAVLTSLLLIWANLAVGIIGDEGYAANVMYHSVLAIAVTSSLLARFQPLGMAGAMIVTAIAQAAIPVIAFTTWYPHPAMDVIKVFAVNTLFVALYATAAMLFVLAGRNEVKISNVA